MTRVGLVVVWLAFAGCGGNVRGSGNNGPNGGPDTSGGSAAAEPPPGWAARDDTPTARSGAAAVIDEVADRLVVYGGSGNDTWALPLSGPNAKHWQPILATGSFPPVETQSAGQAQAALYDPFGQRLLLMLDVFGQSVDQPQLWQLSLSGPPVWQQLNPDGPAPGQEITFAKMALDRTNKRAVFVGGGSTPGVWALSLDGAGTWSRLGGVPPVDLSLGLFPLSLGGALAVDEQRGGLVLVEGYDRTPNVWRMDWTTATWTELGKLNCGADLDATIVFDSHGERLLGTSEGCGVTTFSLATGATQSVTGAALAVDYGSEAGIAVDEKRQRVLYFSGSAENSVRALALTDLKVSVAEPNTRGAVTPGDTAVWDAGRKAVVSFADSRDSGGTESHGLGAHDSWLPLAIGSPAPGYDSAGVADPDDGSIVAFGRGTLAQVDTVYRLPAGAGQKWQTVTTNQGPAPRSGHVAVYDSTQRRMLIHGGIQGASYPPGTVFGDTWALALDGTPTWSLLDTHGDSPGARFGEGAIYDPVGQRMIVYAGNDESAQNLLPSLHSLALDGSLEWSELDPSGTPPPVTERLSVVYDPSGQRMLLANVGDGRVFALDLAALAWHEFCVTGLVPGAQYSAFQNDRNVVVAPDGLFASANGGAYRFNLSTPYCD